ncbi:aspartate aminotransferase family protein [Brevibacterium jeotgali]|uniref:4-aminobutyrate aminotransferase n=1 Tax=Brevibacterium jeotgali TaxID=1262550 RepID=A0A2H1L2R6_9MICO|nr:aminotransferase class III-fold pyridoxal phosphate-dependent enzyme [Brevibacterium jeotgali]TWC03067.1 4-aminobutyrate aminotransferase-like enzyme [Brevibacterium jeotgali]SMY11090.1 4-aminobutyrate aminotransferase [Brevibacterium jeotgali]
MSDDGHVPAAPRRTPAAPRRAGTYRTFYSEPLTVASAQGCTITDTSGIDHLDAYNNVPVIGHSHPAIADAVHAQLLRANTHTRYLDDIVDAYSRDLLALLPQHIESVVYTCSGSEANDLALQVAAYSSMSSGVIVARRAYHGTTSATAAISPSLSPGPRDHVVTVDIPAAEDPDFEQDLADRVRRAAAELERRGHGTSAFVLDSTMTSEGIVAGEHVRLAAAVDAVHDAGGFYIADEVQAGFFRTGAWWGYEALGVAPDLVTLGKPMGGGMPIAAVAGPRVVFSDFGGQQRYFNTFAGTPAPIAAAHAVLVTLRDGGFGERVADAGSRLGEGLVDALAEAGVDGRIRRAGLMVGVDLRPAAGDDARAGALAEEIVEAMYARRVLVSRTGPGDAVLKIRPPLVITDEEIDRLVDAFRGALADVAGTGVRERADG